MSKKIVLKDKKFELYLSQEQILEAVSEMAVRIKDDCKEESPLLVVMLSGAFMFASELLSELDTDYEIAFVKYASYEGMHSTSQLKELLPLTTELKGRSVIVIEDIIDSGFTMLQMKKLLESKGVKSFKVASMLYKPQAEKYGIKPDYVCFEIPNDFIVGHGLDYDGFGRCYKDIYRIEKE